MQTNNTMEQWIYVQIFTEKTITEIRSPIEIGTDNHSMHTHRKYRE